MIRPRSEARRRRILRLVAAVLIAQASAAVATPAVERRVALMGTTLTIEISGLDRPSGLALAERMVRAVEDAETRLSTWRESSEIQSLNRAVVGERVALSRPTWEALDAALACASESAGAFDPTAAPLVQAWGLRTGGREPSAAEIQAALERTGAAAIELVDEPLGARKLAEREIEEGGFGKGAALDEALELARDVSVRLDLGGQLAWADAPGPVVVELADPRDRGRAVAEVEIGAAHGSLATSGDSERIGHLLDPRSGRPAGDFGSVAVFAPTALEADCLSTALFVLGPERGSLWLAAHGAGIEAVFLIEDGGRLRAQATPGLEGRLRALVPELRIGPERRTRP